MKSQQAMLQPGLRRQQGGTLLGLIIGLVVGLAIAVAVALLITKSSTPFTNKNGNKADMPTSQLLDPNKPLYGNKDAAKEAAKDLAKDANAAKPADVADNKPAAALERPAPAPVPAPIAAPVAAKPVAEPRTADAPAAAKADGGDDKYVYFLQAGAFREQADAESARAKLALLGFEARISERPSENGNLYRVRIGPFSQVETMNRMRAKLSENSVDVAVVRTAK